MKKRNIEEEIHNLDVLIRDNEQIPQKVRNSILKQVEIVRKCAKPRRSNKGRNQNQNSGLLKPVIISDEMAEFANWGKGELYSRVDVTKVICNYVKVNQLQKPSNKKTILPDDNLTKILRWYSADEQMKISVVNFSEISGVFSISETPTVGLKKPEYYNNSDLKNQTGGVLAIIKKVELLEDGNYNFTLDKEIALNKDDIYTIHVPLTYPKVQTKISVHLTKPEKPEEIPKEKEKKEKKKETKKETKPKKKETKEPSSSEE